MLMHITESPQKYNKKKESYVIYYKDCGFLEVPNNFLHKKRFTEQYELLYVTKGILYINLDSNPLVLSKNNLVIIPPYKIISGAQPSLQATSFYYVDFMTDNPVEFNISAGKVQTNNSAKIIEHLEFFIKQKNKTDSPAFIKDAGLLLLLYEISNETEKFSGSHEIALIVKKYIERNISKPLTADILSADLNYNKDYLCRAVKKHFGIPLKDYIIKQKLDLSKKLLITSNYSISEIGVLIGYTDANLFTKFFKYHIKKNPSEYRIIYST